MATAHYYRLLKYIWFAMLIVLLILLQTLLLVFAHPKTYLAPARKELPYAILPGYGAFEGTRISTTLNNIPLPYAVDAWLGIEYATQPVGQGRFAPPSWPAPFSGVKDASQYGPSCIQGLRESSSQSEACLNFNVYRTSGISLTRKLPVLVWIHGGSFVAGSGRSLDGAAFVAQSAEPVMVITFQYRLGSLGSLPSKLFQDEGLLNLGLRDQRLFLEFLQTHVTQFGGDKDAITLGGQSAGAHSVGIHYFHNYGPDRGSPLFSQAIMASGSVTARAFPTATSPLYETQFEQYMDYLDCPTNDNAAALTCLRSADISAIQYVQAVLYADYERNITWPFQPVRGGPLLEKPGSVSGIEQTFFHLPILVSSTTDEGKAFVPEDLNTDQEVAELVRTISPGLTTTDMAELERLYLSPVKYPNKSPYRASPRSIQFDRIAAGYGDYSYICPVQETAFRTSSAGVPTWKARFNTPNNNAAWAGIPHAADSRYYNGLPDVEYPDVSHMYHAYYASFVVSGDPNTFCAEGSPYWEQYHDSGGDGQGLQLVVNPNGMSGMEKESDGMRFEQCQWWRQPDRMRRLNK